MKTTPLIEAIFTENIEEALRLIQANDRINQALPSGKTPLHLAAERGQVEIVEALLENGANPKLTDADNQTPLLLAEEHNHAAIVALLRPLTATKKNGVPNIDSGKMLIDAAKEGSLEKVQAALAARADVNYANEHGSTALTWACEKGHTEIVRSLLNAGANANHAIKNGSTPLTLAAGYGHLAIVSLLLNPEYEVNINYKDKKGKTALMWAREKGATGIVNLLFEHENKLKTPLMQALYARDEKAALTLISNGADLDVDARGPHGETALYLASELGYVSVVNALLSKNANPNLVLHDSSTPLGIAAQLGRTEVVKLLLEHGADENLMIKETYTPLYLAAKYKFDETIKVLLHHAAAKNDNHHNKHQDLVNTINKVICVKDGEDLPHIRKGIREKLVTVLKERTSKIQEDVDQVKAEITGLENIRDQVVILKKRDGEKKEKTATIEINSLIAQLKHQCIQLEKTMTTSLVDAVNYLATSAAKDNDVHDAIIYLLRTTMNDVQQAELLAALKKLKPKQFDRLKNHLKNAIPVVENEKLLIEEQRRLKDAFLAHKAYNAKKEQGEKLSELDDPYNNNPFLFILRTGTSEYEQKDTDSFTTVRNKIFGTPLTDTLKKVGIFIFGKSKELQQKQNAEVKSKNGVYDSL
jgi:ankyrin repeat protein